MITDPALTLDELARALGSESAASPVWKTVAPHLHTLLSRPGETVRPGNGRSDDSVMARLRLDGEVPLIFGDELGRGGMGIVRLATQTSVGRLVAVKSLRAGAAAEGAAVNLLQEAWITGAVEHPHIVPLYDVGLDATGQPLVVLKRIEGTSWRALMDADDAVRARFGVSDVLEWHVRTLMQICTAAHFAHHRGIIHRDIKPDNVMVGAPGEVYLVDWGIARAWRAEGDGRLPRLDPAEGMAGTPTYMAPEMMGSPGSVLAPHTDVYLLGATLYHILAGRAPHQGTTALEIMLKVLRGPPPPPGPPELVAICLRAMALAPQDRYPDADGFRQALQRYLEHRGATRLAEDAGVCLAALEIGLTTGMPAFERQQLFGECRFGFTQALESWPHCQPAIEGRTRAITLMIGQALEEAQADAASALLAELVDPPPDLVLRVAAAQASAEARQIRLRRLERIQAEFDPGEGTRPRSVFLGAIVALLMVRPTVWLLNRPQDGFLAWLWPSVMLSIALISLWFARQLLLGTAFNRRISGMVLATLVAYAGLSLGHSIADAPLTMRSQQGMHFGASILGIFAIAVDLRALVPGIAYLAGYLASIAGLINPHLAILLCHGILGTTLWWIGRVPPPEGSFIQVDRRGLRNRLKGS